MESSPTTMAPLLLRKLLTTIFFYADKSLLTLAEKHKLLQLIRYIVVSAFLFFLGLLPSLFPGLNPSVDNYNYPLKPPRTESYNQPNGGGGGGGGGVGESGIARALSQLLSIVNDLPVSSRKYEVVRSLAERLIDENLLEGNETLREVNCTVISAAFSRTLSQLEAAVLSQGQRSGGGGGVNGDVIDGAHSEDSYRYRYRLNRVLGAVRHYGDVMWRLGKSREELSRSGSSAEKLAAELLWLSQKLAACGCGDEAVTRWASASNLAWLALSTELRLQGFMVKVSAFLIKQAKDMGSEADEESKKEQQRQTKMRLLMSWIPLLCRASSGTEAPVLSFNEKAELESVLEAIIGVLEQGDEQEKVLSLWLHHFTYCPSSDWPDLHSCYTRWCTASRRLLIAQ
ncbi:unnamed protein product [Ilex paraguariensis]|uniref:Uncharacterized protein n=1 Tax=Ilex paraguariensis TaxID=185542 RepID=A0ABC8T109_9AQUA